jgi:hypothetical protein
MEGVCVSESKDGGGYEKAVGCCEERGKIETLRADAKITLQNW